MKRSLRVVGDMAHAVVARHEVVTSLDTLEEILRWGGHVIEVVVQDEYTHDVIVDGRGGSWLVFDTT